MRFLHPSIKNGGVGIGQGEESWSIVDGVVDCPAEIGKAAGWKLAPEPKAEPPSIDTGEFLKTALGSRKGKR